VPKKIKLGKNEKRILQKLKKHKKLRSKKIFPNRKTPSNSFKSLEKKGLIKWEGGVSRKKGEGNLGYLWSVTPKGRKQKKL